MYYLRMISQLVDHHHNISVYKQEILQGIGDSFCILFHLLYIIFLAASNKQETNKPYTHQFLQVFFILQFNFLIIITASPRKTNKKPACQQATIPVLLFSLRFDLIASFPTCASFCSILYTLFSHYHWFSHTCHSCILLYFPYHQCLSL